ncbi:MAG: MFS transporter [Acidimicrobiales bacterium]
MATDDAAARPPSGAARDDTVEGTPAPSRVPANLRILLGANLVSSIGSGLTLPFLLIYLHNVRHIPLGLSGVLIGASALVGIPAGPIAGALVDRLGARLVSASGLAFAGLGTASLVFVRSAASAVPVLLLVGFSQSSLWPTWNALFAVMVPDESLRPRVFARGFQLLNLGLGIGAMVAGAVVRVSNPSTFDLVYLVDAITNFVVVIALVLLPAHAFGRTERAASAGGDHVTAKPSGGYREVLGDRRFRRFLLASAFLGFAGYAAVEAGLVGYAIHVVHVGSYVISWAFGLNTGMIVVLQPLGLRLAGRFRRTTSLMICATCFGVSWLVLLAAGGAAGTVTGEILVVAMFGVFSLGEILLAPVGGPLVTMLATPELQGRYNASAASVLTTLGVVGPALAGVLLGAGLGGVYLLALSASAAVAIFAFWQLRRVLSPQIDNASADRAVTAT